MSNTDNQYDDISHVSALIAKYKRTCICDMVATWVFAFCAGLLCGNFIKLFFAFFETGVVDSKKAIVVILSWAAIIVAFTIKRKTRSLDDALEAEIEGLLGLSVREEGDL